MSTGELLRSVIVDGSAFVTGLALYGAVVHARRVLREPWRTWVILGALGLAIDWALLAEAVVRTPFIPSSWRSWMYSIGLVMLGVGILGALFSGLAIVKLGKRKGMYRR